MRITSSLLAFIFLGVAAAGVIPEIAVRDITGGQGGHTIGFPSKVSDLPVPTDFPHPALGTPSDVYHHKPTGNLYSSTEPIVKPSPTLVSHEARAFNPTAVHSIHAISRRASPTDV